MLSRHRQTLRFFPVSCLSLSLSRYISLFLSLFLSYVALIGHKPCIQRRTHRCWWSVRTTIVLKCGNLYGICSGLRILSAALFYRWHPYWSLITRRFARTPGPLPVMNFMVLYVLTVRLRIITDKTHPTSRLRTVYFSQRARVPRPL